MKIFLHPLFMNVIGILGFQGDIEEHEAHIRLLGKMSVRVRSVEDIQGISHIVFPGGESTTIGKWLQSTGLGVAIQRRVQEGTLSVFGTCAGAILLASEVESKVPVHNLGLINATLSRNAYGSQIHSFETEIHSPVLQKSFQAIFIRAPKIIKVESSVQVLASFNNDIVLAQEGKVLIATFHPELTTDTTIYEYFLSF